MQIIGVDMGRDSVKVVTAGKKLAFRSKVGEWRERRLSTGGDYEVTIDQSKYFVADLADESFCVREMATESKIHEETKILFKTAIALVANPGEKLCITTGLPVDQHTPDTKKEFACFLEGLHTVQINNRAPVTFLVHAPAIAPESGGAYWDTILDDSGTIKPGILSTQTIRVVDIGSRTINGCTVDIVNAPYIQRKYIDRDSFTLSYGTLELRNAEANPGAGICEQFARKIVGDLSKKWMNYKPQNDVVLLTGGGANLLGKWLKPHFPLVHVSEDPVFANASGFYKMGLLKWAGK